MGYFNETDFITRLPIKEGDEVYAIPVEAANMISNGQALASLRYYAPMCWPLKGKYDGYGSINGCKDTEAFDFLNMLLEKKALDHFGGINLSEIEGLEDFLEEVSHGRIWVNNMPVNSDESTYKQERWLSTGLCFVKSEVLDALLVEIKEEYKGALRELKEDWIKNIGRYKSDPDWEMLPTYRFLSEPGYACFRNLIRYATKNPDNLVDKVMKISALNLAVNMLRVPYLPLNTAEQEGLNKLDLIVQKEREKLINQQF